MARTSAPLKNRARRLALGMALAAALIAGLLPSYLDSDVGVGLAGASVLACLALFSFQQWANREGTVWLGKLLIISFALRLTIALVGSDLLYSYYPVNDSNLYDFYGREIAAHLKEGQIMNVPASIGVIAYSYLTGFVYALFGPSWTLMQVLNSFIGTVGVFFFFKAFQTFLPPGVLKTAVYLTALMPSILLWTSLHLRDPWIFLMIGLLAYGMALAMQRGWMKPWLMCATAIGGLMLLRPYVAAVAVASLIPSVTLFKPLRIRPSAFGVRLTLCVIAITLGLYVLTKAQQLVLGTEPISYEILTNIRNAAAVEGSALPPVAFRSWTDAIAHIPLGSINFLFRPLPWEAYNLPAVVASAENSFLVVLVLMALISGRWWQSLRTMRSFWPMLIFAAGVTAVYALIGGNLGTLMRVKIQVLPFLLAFAALGLARLRPSG